MVARSATSVAMRRPHPNRNTRNPPQEKAVHILDQKNLHRRRPRHHDHHFPAQHAPIPGIGKAEGVHESLIGIPVGSGPTHTISQRTKKIQHMGF